MMLLILVTCLGLASANPNPDSSKTAAREAYLGHYGIEDSCQYEICGVNYNSEFKGRMGGSPTQGSCSGDCDATAARLVNSKYKKENLWGSCSEMCVEKFPHHEYRTYNERLGCMDDCFTAFELVSPHHHVAQTCLHAACNRRLRMRTQQTGLECFERCTHHVGRKVPQEDWPAWADLLATAPCGDEDDQQPQQPQQSIPATPPEDRLACTDKKLWDELTASSEVSADTRLLCLNAMCDYNVACAKQCHDHVSVRVAQADLPFWQQCTYSPACSKIHSYALREECADRCLEEHKEEKRRKALEARMRDEERRKKEAEALMSSSKATNIKTSLSIITAILFAIVRVV